MMGRRAPPRVAPLFFDSHPNPIIAMAHEPRLLQSLRALLHTRRTAALGTLSAPATAGASLPYVSFVPYAVDTQTGTLVLHVSGLAAHTRQMQQCPEVSLLICAAEQPGEPVHALERVTFTGHAAVLAPEAAASARAAYLARFPEAAPMTALGDFRFVAITPMAARHVAGFGAARDVDAEECRAVLSHLPNLPNPPA